MKASNAIKKIFQISYILFPAPPMSAFLSPYMYQSCWKSHFMDAFPPSFCYCLILYPGRKTHWDLYLVSPLRCGCIYKLNAVCINLLRGLLKWLLRLTITPQLCFLFQLALGHRDAQYSRICPKAFSGLIDKAGSSNMVLVFNVRADFH